MTNGHLQVLAPTATRDPLNEIHTHFSSLREKVLEHLFVGELLRTLWCMGSHSVEVLRPEVDNGGYDVVVECNSIVRHIQLKSSHRLGKASRQKVNQNIAIKPGGCVIWMIFDQATLELGPFYWFGGAAGEPIPSLGHRIARHTKGNRDGYKAERKNIRVINKGEFRQLSSMREVAGELFGGGGS